MTDPKEDPSLEQAMGGEKEIQERPTRPIEVFNSEEMARQFQADGEASGLSGPKLDKYVQDCMRDARARFHDRQAASLSKQQELEARQRDLRLRELEIEERKKEREEKEKERKLKERELEIEEQKLKNLETLKQQELNHAETLRQKELDLEKEKLKQAEILRQKELDLEKEKLKQAEVLKQQELKQAEDLKERELKALADAQAKKLDLKERELKALQKDREDRIAREKARDEQRAEHDRMSQRPKIPYFDDKTDDIQAYLDRFKEHCSARKWRIEEWPLILRDLLRGKALTYFQELTDISQYEDVAAHLLKRFNCTESGFREAFRKARPGAEETMTTFFARMKLSFQKWIDMAEVGKDFSKLVDLVLKEQFFAAVCTDLVKHLKLIKYSGMENLVADAERFQDGNPGLKMASKAPVETASVGITQQGGRQGAGGGGGHRPQYRQYTNSGGTNSGGTEGKSGETRSDKPQTLNRGTKRDITGIYNQLPPDCQDRSKDPRWRSCCWVCGQKDHLWYACKAGIAHEPQLACVSIQQVQVRDQVSLAGSSGHTDQSTVSSDSQTAAAGAQVQPTQPTSESAHGVQQEVLPSTPSNQSASLANVGLSAVGALPPVIQTCQGTLNGRECTIMLDSGCSTCGVRRSLVEPDQFTGQTQRCRLFTGELVELPLARVQLESPCYSGQALACVIDHPVCDVILGRLPGARFEAVMPTAGHVPAQAAVDQRPFGPLATEKTPELDITPDRLHQLQQSDDSLKPLFYKAHNQAGSKMNTREESLHIKDGLLYRCIFSKKTQVITWQVVVPVMLRQSVLDAAHDSCEGKHVSAGMTAQRIASVCYWPSYRLDIRRSCQTCEPCQRARHKTLTAHALDRHKSLLNPPSDTVSSEHRSAPDMSDTHSKPDQPSQHNHKRSKRLEETQTRQARSRVSPLSILPLVFGVVALIVGSALCTSSSASVFFDTPGKKLAQVELDVFRTEHEVMKGTNAWMIEAEYRYITHQRIDHETHSSSWTEQKTCQETMPPFSHYLWKFCLKEIALFTLISCLFITMLTVVRHLRTWPVVRNTGSDCSRTFARIITMPLFKRGISFILLMVILVTYALSHPCIPDSKNDVGFKLARFKLPNPYHRLSVTGEIGKRDAPLRIKCSVMMLSCKVKVIPVEVKMLKEHQYTFARLQTVLSKQQRIDVPDSHRSFSVRTKTSRVGKWVVDESNMQSWGKRLFLIFDLEQLTYLEQSKSVNEHLLRRSASLQKDRLSVLNCGKRTMMQTYFDVWEIW